MRRPARLPTTYHVDPDDPRAPPMDVWERLSPAERKRVVASLPSEFPVSESMPPEGDEHFTSKTGARTALGGYYTRVRPRVYLACDLPVYYPGEPMFAPDVLAVLDVETHKRERWAVTDEGRGLDFALEIIVSGHRRKDLVENVERYARLGISEYFVFDFHRKKLSGHRLPATPATTASPAPKAGKKKRRYQPILPQGGRYASQVLGLDLTIEGERLRFYHGSSMLLEAEEMVGALERMLATVEARARAAEERADEEARKWKKEAKLRKAEAKLRKEAERLKGEAERRLAEALAEIERLKKTMR